MKRSMSRACRVVLAAAPLVGAACAELTNPSQSALSTAALTGAFSSVPVGYGDLSSSYIGTSASGVQSAGLWLGGGRDGSFDRGSLMGGGVQGASATAGGSAAVSAVRDRSAAASPAPAPSTHRPAASPARL